MSNVTRLSRKRVFDTALVFDAGRDVYYLNWQTSEEEMLQACHLDDPEDYHRAGEVLAWTYFESVRTNKMVEHEKIKEATVLAAMMNIRTRLDNDVIPPDIDSLAVLVQRNHLVTTRTVNVWPCLLSGRINHHFAIGGSAAGQLIDALVAKTQPDIRDTLITPDPRLAPLPRVPLVLEKSPSPSLPDFFADFLKAPTTGSADLEAHLRDTLRDGNHRTFVTPLELIRGIKLVIAGNDNNG